MRVNSSGIKEIRKRQPHLLNSHYVWVARSTAAYEPSGCRVVGNFIFVLTHTPTHTFTLHLLQSFPTPQLSYSSCCFKVYTSHLTFVFLSTPLLYNILFAVTCTCPSSLIGIKIKVELGVVTGATRNVH